MARYRITGPDGATYEVNAPDGATDAEILDFVRSNAATAQPAPQTKPAGRPTIPQRVMASPVGGVLHGMRKPLDAWAEYAPWALGTAAGAVGADQLSAGLLSEAERVRAMNQEHERFYQESRRATGREGADPAAFIGEVASPVNVALGMTAGAAPVSVLGRVGYGAAVGGLGAAGVAPGADVPMEQYGAEKAAQTTLGAVAGGVVTPMAGKVVDVLGKATDRVINAIGGRFRRIDDASIFDRLRFELAKEDIDIGQIPEGIRNRVVRDVGDALRRGEKLDGAALIRKIDFDQFGVPGTRGQITRDGPQWAREFNLRSIDGAGEPLANQARAVVDRARGNLNAMGGNTVESAYDAGNRVIGALSARDAARKAPVDAAYQAARDASGRYAPLNTAQFSQMANDALDEGMLGSTLKSSAPEVMSLLNQVSKGEIPLNVNTAVQLERLFGNAQARLTRSGDRNGALAVGTVLDALRRTDLSDDAARMLPDGQDARSAFIAARKLAADRFRAIEANPAIKAVIDGKANPDTIINDFVFRAKNTDQLRSMADDLGEGGRQIVKEQIARSLKESAFGSGAAGDVSKDMAVDRYKRALDKFGRERLGMFFKPEEVDDLYRIARVATYTSTQPPGVTPNRSGTAAAAFNLLQRMQGIPLAVPTIRGIVDQAAASRALSAQVPTEPLPVITPTLRDLLGAVPIGVGVAQAQP